MKANSSMRLFGLVCGRVERLGGGGGLGPRLTAEGGPTASGGDATETRRRRSLSTCRPSLGRSTGRNA